MKDHRNVLRRLLAALHESRRRQAEREINRHAHLFDTAAAYEARRADNRRRATEILEQWALAS